MCARLTTTLWLLASLLLPTHAQSEAFTPRGMLDFNLYPYQSDVDTDSVFTLNTASTLPGRLSYFGFINLAGQNDGTDTTGYYAEQSLYWKTGASYGLDLTAQAAFASGEDNDKLRLGVRWRAHDTGFSRALFEYLHLNYTLNLHFVQFDHSSAYVWQLEHAFYLRMPYLSERLYLGGFMDHTFNEDLPTGFPSNPVVAEAQLGYRLWDRLYLVGEYRINQYRRSDVNNFAAGLEYKITF
ncbi:hypothetical protein [Gilvimarinus algae]|uniref:Outer membrane protein beta-barrel domain-containing protein n=1 Tax=Gilvimarinus algae TaxID=3058037 RepID=A0ABT8THR3_9GAMM|nr:hypothetical protein [Gilvimarinus sp. SDUM040014]MDO3383639.1 hypothetical protein [Gilvimarinus sp. SDUM040014]